MKNYLLAVTTLMGTIIGVGVFTLPYIINQTGVLPLFFYMLVLGVIQYHLHLLYAEIVLSVKTEHRLPGYVEKYYGAWGKNITFIITVLSDYGSMIAYIIAGGLFLYQLLNPVMGGGLLFYTTSLFLAEAMIVFFGIKSITGSEFIMTGFLAVIIILISWRAWEFITPANYQAVTWHNLLLPYGPIFFAISGEAAIPEVCKLLKNHKEKVRSAIFWGTFLPIIVMTVFTITVVGITGAATTSDALAGLSLVFGDGVIRLALLFGLLAVVTSMITIAQASREVFWWDFKINKNVAWLLACAVPYLVYLAGLRNLTKTVSLTGALAGGIVGLVILWLVLKVKAKREQASPINNNLNKLLAGVLSFTFVFGLIYEIWVVLAGTY